jgi:hypothetical protein
LRGSLCIGRCSAGFFGDLLSLEVGDKAANTDNSNNDDDDGSGSNSGLFITDRNTSNIEGLLVFP